MTASDVLIGRASPDDYEALLVMNTAAVPAVNRIEHATLEHLHSQADVLLVARSTEAPVQPIGFLLALSEAADYSSVNFLYFRHRYRSFSYVDRVVVNPDWRGRGIGAKLYQALIDHRGATGLITCEVNLVPPNPRSLTFHQRLGFAQVGEQETEGGIKRVALMALTMGYDGN